MKILIAMLIMVSIAGAKVPGPCLPEVRILETKGIDLDTKTLKGWVRLLNNRSKQGEYGIVLTKAETMALIKCLTEELNNRKARGKLR